MPRGDGTGPSGTGPSQRGARRRAGGGRMSGETGMGPGGSCICPKCGEKVAHTAGIPCNELKCEKCGTAMVRG
jgi:hypothetical protein